VLVPSAAGVTGCCAEASGAAALRQPRMNNHASIGSLLAVIVFKDCAESAIVFISPIFTHKFFSCQEDKLIFYF
jgi:hypothetical protein